MSLPRKKSLLRRLCEFVEVAIQVLLSPLRELLHTLGLAQDDLHRAQLGSRGRVRSVATIVRGFVLGLSRVPLVCVTFLLSVFWDLLYWVGVARDGADAARVLRQGLYRRALPVVGAAIAAIVALSWVITTSDLGLVDRYVDAAERAETAHDDRAAEMCYERLSQLQPNVPEYRYQAALVAERLGDYARAAVLMHELADPRRAGYAPAHFWQAEKLLAKPRLSLIEARTVWAHLARGLETSPDDSQAHYQMTRLLLNLGCIAEAEPHLAVAARSHPELLLVLAKVHRGAGRTADAKLEAGLAVNYLADKVTADPDDAPSRAALVQSRLFLEQYREAIDVLHESSARQDEPAIHRQIAEICVAWGDAELRQSGDEQDYVDRLQMALEADPGNTNIITRLITVRGRGGQAGLRAARYLDSLSLDAVTPPGHVMLGTDALAHGQPIVARRHYEEALRRDPELPEAANNLAWLLSHVEPMDVPRALGLIESALARFPGRPALLETRGQIYLQLERWQDARHDLETVQFVKHDDPGLRALLAQCYEHLGVAPRGKETSGASSTNKVQ
ncbi:MAG TPA: tetratricopeptide repeat protein [Pirellulales bacterium]|jgi:tetratricopeptide (TPR) repeat protein|nr:tetratricopeptide repeat protein [Pirellulales bacterium]